MAKSVTSLSILRLVPAPGEIIAGEILFEGEDLLRKSAREMEKIRGRKISMIFQEPDDFAQPVAIRGRNKSANVTGSTWDIRKKLPVTTLSMF